MTPSSTITTRLRLGSGLVLMTFMALDGEIRTARRMTPGVWAIASVWLAAGAIALVLVSIGAF